MDTGATPETERMERPAEPRAKRAPRRAPLAPSRRSVLLAALTTGAGVALTRVLGMRDFDERALVASLRRTLFGTGAEDSLRAPQLPLPVVASAPSAPPAPSTTASAAPPSATPATSRAPAAATPPPSVAPSAPPMDAPVAQLGLDWVSPLAQDPAKVAHLLRRATFGASAAELDRAVADGYERTLQRLLETKFADPPALAGADDATGMSPLKVDALQRWWVEHMMASPTPFTERMTLFWHGHFVSDYRKVGLQSPFIYWQNLTWRRHALADLRTLVYQATIDPAMLRYLDLGASSGRNPNENYGRELMEVFTMGVGHYTEDDVKAAAKALAGWREPRTKAMIDAVIARQTMQGKPVKDVPQADAVATGVFEPRRAYGGTVTYLGRTGAFDAQAVIDRILDQDATAPFVVRKVVTEFVTPEPSDAYVARLASRFRASRYDMKSLLYDVFRSPEFVAEDSYRALVKSPAEFMVNVAKALDAPQLTPLIVQSSSGMGQSLFDPPSVGGWPRNAAWVSSNTMLARANFVTAALGQLRQLPPADRAHLRHLDGMLGPATQASLAAATDDRRRWWVVLTSPEFQLK